MRAKDLVAYLEDVINKADDPDGIEVICRDKDIKSVGYSVDVDECGVSDECIEIKL